jgi:chromosome segregation ATPase
MAFLCLLILTLVLCVTAGDPTDSSSALKAFEREHKRYRNTVEDRQKAFSKRSEAHQQALTSLGGLYQADRSKKQVRKAQKQALEKYENELKRAESRVGSAKSRVRTADDELKSAREEEKFAREALKNQEKAWSFHEEQARWHSNHQDLIREEGERRIAVEQALSICERFGANCQTQFEQ